jgi:hypothetical protein
MRARVLGWSAALVATGTLGGLVVAPIPVEAKLRPTISSASDCFVDVDADQDYNASAGPLSAVATTWIVAGGQSR